MSCKVNQNNVEAYNKLKELTGSDLLSLKLLGYSSTPEFNKWLGTTRLVVTDEGAVINDAGDVRFLVDIAKPGDTMLNVEFNPVYSTKPSNTNLRVALMDLPSGNEAYKESLSEVEKTVSNKFFRYTTAKGIGKPYKNYDTGSHSKNYKLRDTINRYFDREVVFYNPTKQLIEFTAKAKFARSITVEDVMDYEASIELEAQREYEKYKEFTDDLAFEVGTPEHKFASLITKLEKNKKLLERQNTEVKGSDPEVTRNKRSIIKAKISAIDAEIKKITATESDEAIVSVGNSQVKGINKRLIKINDTDFTTLTDAELLDTMREVQELGFHLKAWKDVKSMINASEVKGLNNLLGSLELTHDKLYIETFKDMFIVFADRKSNVNIDPEILNTSKDISKWKANVFGAWMSGDDLIEITDDIMSQAVYEADRDYLVKESEIKQQVKELLKAKPNLDKDEIYEYFLQKFENGKKTGRIVSQTKPEYYRKRDSLFNQTKKFKKGSVKYKAAIKEYNKFITDNNYIISKSEAESKQSDTFTTDELDKQSRLLEEYKVLRKATEENIKDEFTFIETLEDGSTREIVDEAGVSNALEEFENKTSPYKYWDSKGKLGSKTYILYPKPKEQWNDPRYNTIQSDPSLKKFYEFMFDTFKTNSSYLPHTYETGSNFLPEISKTLGEKLSEEGILKVAKNLPSNLKEAVREEAEDIIEIIKIEDTEYHSVPVSGRSGKVTLEQRSFDLENILLSDTKQSLSYKYRDDVKVVAEAANEFMSNKRDVDTKELMDSSKKMLEYAIESKLFSRRRKAREGKFGKKTLSQEDKQYLESIDVEPSIVGLEAEKQRLKNLFKEGTIDRIDYKNAINKLNQIKEKQYTVGAIGDQVIKLTYLKALSFPNVLSPVVNLAIGEMSNIMTAVGNEFYTFKDYVKAAKISGMMLKGTAKKDDIEKMWAFMSSLGVLGHQNESLYSRGRTWIDKLTFLQEHTEKLVQGKSMIAQLVSEKTGLLTDKNGNKVSVWDAYKVENGLLVWDESKMGIQPENTQKSVDGNSVNLYRLGKKVNKTIALGGHGDYSSPLMIKKSVLGRVMMLFRTWMSSAIENRFSELQYDKDLETFRKGRIRSLFELHDKEGHKTGGFKEVLELIYKKGQFAKLSETDQANIRKDLVELSFIASMAIVLGMLKNLDTDDEDEKRYLNLLMNATNRFQNDLSFFYSPNSSVKFFDNAVPIYTTVTDLINVTGALYDSVTGDPFYKGGTNEGKSRLVHSVLKNVPIATGVIKLEGAAERFYDY